MLNDFKKLTEEQDFIREWLERINETDPLQINEVMELMRTNREYREFILSYAQGTK